jgi:glycosyltransferase involved in cell wall biosynthesis
MMRPQRGGRERGERHETGNRFEHGAEFHFKGCPTKTAWTHACLRTPRFSVIIPARNEEGFIGRCLESIRAAGTPYQDRLETIVVLNRCSDRTEEIAQGLYSAGIQATLWLLRLLLVIYGISGGLFWCRREDFEAIGGFNEKLISGEDVDFARRLKAHGKSVQRPFSTLRGAPIVTSCRKFDRLGDWLVLTNPILIWRILRGNDRRTADLFYYDFER